ncbi:spore coat protein YutH [Scopulibacillus daqui]|uniref:Spore coat protein YutH n=1 Tax=Scopulibacillus daqui TaxID=1469162 RepID=A0ABS2Q1K8_9BACL|nr:hypothetical protein [Scopulibacillus daqui]MBM7646088.1 spore coat protein YutH [Scopulibacillus daqui]
MNNRSFHYDQYRKDAVQNQTVELPLDKFHHDDIEELAALAYGFRQRGEKGVAVIAPEQKKKWAARKNEDTVLLIVPPHFRQNVPLPKELARFHQSGSFFQFRKLDDTPYVNNVNYWINRLDDLWDRYKECQKSRTITDFENHFIKVFPYFAGLGENAVQYMVDLRLDYSVFEKPAVCHHRFTDDTWAFGPYWIKSPADWVIDHPSRDLAEWMRGAVLDNKSYQEIESFLQAYHQENPITSLGKSLIMGRLLFPLSFIELSEAYFEDKKRNESLYMDVLLKSLSRMEQYESFLKWFAQENLAEIKTVDWLVSNVKR